MIKIQNLISEKYCYETVRQLRWPEKVCCVHCRSLEIKKRGKDEIHRDRQRYCCKECGKHFDDLTNTVFSGHRQPLKVWIICLYFMGLNISNRQIAQELSLNESDVYEMTSILRSKVVEKQPEESLSDEVEIDEVYVVAGHKGKPDEVKKSVILEDGALKEPEVEGLYKKKSHLF